MELRVKLKTQPKPKTIRKREELESEKLFSNKYSYAENLNNEKVENNLAEQNVINLLDLSPKNSKNLSKIDSSNIHKNHRSRLKQQFLKNGLASLSDVQKLELLLYFSIPQRDTNPLAHALLNEFGSIKNVLLASTDQLQKVSGIKETSATLIKLVSDLMNIINMPDTKLAFINNPTEACEFCSKFYQGVDVEQFYVVCIGKDNHIIKYKMINTGLLDEVPIQIRAITHFAIEQKCSRIIISHNHPNGTARASDEDIRFTFSLLCSCLLNNIDILDHVIIGKNELYSFKNGGIMDGLRNRASKSILLSKDMQANISENESLYTSSNPQKPDVHMQKLLNELQIPF